MGKEKPNKAENEAVFNEEYKIADDADTAAKKKRNKKRRKKIKKNLFAFLWVVAIFSTAILLAGGIIYVFSDMLGIRINSGGDEKIKVHIPEGTVTAQIAEILKDYNVINNPEVFRLYSKVKGYDSQYKYGVYEFTRELAYEDIADKLTNEGEKAKTVTIRIPEAATIDEIAELMDDNKVCTAEEFLDAAQNSTFDYAFLSAIPMDKVHYRLEGYLFPDTYDFYTYGSITCAENVIDKMLSQTAKILDAEMLAQIAADGRTVHDILTIASIVELEASAAPMEMAKVAQVFYNRLVWDEPHFLGSSPTAEYPYGDGAYDTNASNPKATEGMPPGPYCAPSAAAIKAAVHPEKDFEMTYFVTDKDMNFYYNSKYKEHINTINKLKNQGKWAG